MDVTYHARLEEERVEERQERGLQGQAVRRIHGSCKPFQRFHLLCSLRHVD